MHSLRVLGRKLEQQWSTRLDAVHEAALTVSEASDGLTQRAAADSLYTDDDVLPRGAYSLSDTHTHTPFLPQYTAKENQPFKVIIKKHIRVPESLMYYDVKHV